MRKKGQRLVGRTSKPSMLRKRCPGKRCRPEAELGAHTRRDVRGSSMSSSESSDQPTTPAEPASEGFPSPVLIWAERYLISSRFDPGGRQQD